MSTCACCWRTGRRHSSGCYARRRHHSGRIRADIPRRRAGHRQGVRLRIVERTSWRARSAYCAVSVHTNKPVSTILSELRHDQRVRKAQRNVMHTLTGSNPPPVASANEKPAAASADRGSARSRSQAAAAQQRPTHPQRRCGPCRSRSRTCRARAQPEAARARRWRRAGWRTVEFARSRLGCSVLAFWRGTLLSHLRSWNKRLAQEW